MGIIVTRGVSMSDVWAGRTGLVAGFTAFHNPRRSQSSRDGRQFCTYQQFFEVRRTLIGHQGAVGEDLSQPWVIGDHHPVVFPDDVRDRGQPGVVSHSKHRSEVTFLPHNSLERF